MPSLLLLFSIAKDLGKRARLRLWRCFAALRMTGMPGSRVTGHEPIFGHHLVELLVNVMPLAHADERQEILLRQLPHLAFRQLLALLMPEVPQLEIGQEIRLIV